MERIIKNKRVCICKSCFKKIDTNYKVKYQKKYYHLSCYYNYIKRGLINNKARVKQLNKSKRKFKKYEKHILLERL